jgi:hypothetical protein
MEDQLSLLKRTFGEIVDIKEGNIEILNNLEIRIKKIKDMYGEFINSNRDKLFVFTLDSFHFQRKLIDLEYEDMKRMFLSITNRMYCDYYKLFKIMVEYVREHIPDAKLADLIKIHDNFPVYKDLEPFKQYEFHFIQELHEIILVILTYIHTYITNKEHDLKVYQGKNQIGLNIDSFVSTFSFNIIVIRQQAILFINYIEFFHKIHTKYLKRFTTKLNLMLSQINNDIKLDHPKDTEYVKNETINDLKEHNLDKQLLREIKVSISDEASVSSDSSNPVSAVGLLEPSENPFEVHCQNDSGWFDKIPSEISDENFQMEPPLEPPIKFAVEPLVEPPVEPPVEPLVEPPVEPLVEPPVEPPVEPLVEPPVEPLVETPVEPLVETPDIFESFYSPLAVSDTTVVVSNETFSI